jgi:AcrR family transcriptional regulator
LPAQRSDAVENRARIIEVARATLATSGELKLNAVAKQAGVGQGTLYRHFPTREDLLAEVYRREVDELVASASILLAENAPDVALSRWFERVAEYAGVKRGVLAAVEAAVSTGLTTASNGPIGDAVTMLLDAGKSNGSIRADVDARDVIILIGYLARIHGAEAEQRAVHLLMIVLDGLRPPRPA